MCATVVILVPYTLKIYILMAGSFKKYCLEKNYLCFLKILYLEWCQNHPKIMATDLTCFIIIVVSTCKSRYLFIVSYISLTIGSYKKYT